MKLRRAATFILALALHAASTTDSEPPPVDVNARAHSTKSEFLVERLAKVLSQGARPAAAGEGPPVEYERAPACISIRNQFDLGCASGTPMTFTCLDGSAAIEPLWMRVLQADGTWGRWLTVTWYTCPTDGPLIAAIEREWTQLQPEASVIALQPNTGWVYAEVPTVATASDAPRLHSTFLLGANVDIRATPVLYTWSWGDGATTVTADPGRAYPAATLTHSYPRTAESATVGLTTTWSGQYRINAGAWVDFNTTVTSASVAAPLQIYDPRSRLVSTAQSES